MTTPAGWYPDPIGLVCLGIGTGSSGPSIRVNHAIDATADSCMASR